MKSTAFERYEDATKGETFYLYGTLSELADSMERYVKPFRLQLSEDRYLSVGQFISPTHYKSAKQLTKPIKLTLHAHIERPLTPEEERGVVPLPPGAREGMSQHERRTLIIPYNPITFDAIPVRGRVKMIGRYFDPALANFFDVLVAEFKDEWGELAGETTEAVAIPIPQTPAEDGEASVRISDCRRRRMDLIKRVVLPEFNRNPELTKEKAAELVTEKGKEEIKDEIARKYPDWKTGIEEEIMERFHERYGSIYIDTIAIKNDWAELKRLGEVQTWNWYKKDNG